VKKQNRDETVKTEPCTYTILQCGTNSVKLCLGHPVEMPTDS